MHLRQAQVLRESGAGAQAALVAAQIVGRWPDWGEGWLLRGQIEQDRNQPEAALNCFAQAQGHDPALIAASLARSRLMLALGQAEAAADLMDSVLREAPDHAAARKQLAWALIGQHRGGGRPPASPCPAATHLPCRRSVDRPVNRAPPDGPVDHRPAGRPPGQEVGANRLRRPAALRRPGTGRGQPTGGGRTLPHAAAPSPGLARRPRHGQFCPSGIEPDGRSRTPCRTGGGPGPQRCRILAVPRPCAPSPKPARRGGGRPAPRPCSSAAPQRRAGTARLGSGDG
ncbi:hypothetical protein PHAMO_260027 [Magnetospirillum molischianum DSM 120]|uniref:Uncharacterized protein n=1 Tax=Magnetospirillum molischianum DSM 120 TaxID=1150626 RepID=H8FS22_MAGML|nr:hypothetical protein PHAMO_260027 [Magnetospirillum molischianum DSM 120]